jgi:hypothetical protein
VDERKQPEAQITDPPGIPLPSDFLGDDVVILPREVAEDGRGLYDESVLTIVKEFRADGVRARYQHGPSSRTWIGERGISTEVTALLIGIASNAGWAALCRLLRRNHGPDHVRVRVGRFRKTKSEMTWEWYRVEGPGAAVANVLATIEPAEEGVAQGAEEQEAPPSAIEPASRG